MSHPILEYFKDDGPHIYTQAILDLLQEKNVTATFFINGDNFMSIYNQTGQAIIKRAIAEVRLQINIHLIYDHIGLEILHYLFN